MARRTPLIAASALLAGAAFAALLTLRAQVRDALDAPADSTRTMRWSPLPRGGGEEWFGAGRVTGVAAAGDRLVVVGGFGVWEQEAPGQGRYVRGGIPGLAASAVTSWQGRIVVALARGGIFMRDGAGWQELVSGFGTLHARVLVESATGELLGGCAEGLFRASPGSPRLERLHARPVRALAASMTRVVSGGEEGLALYEGGRTTYPATDDPWVESVDLAEEDRIHVVTLRGLATGPVDGELRPVRGGDDLVSGMLHRGDYFGIAARPAAAVRRIDATGHVSEEGLPAVPTRLARAGGELFAATDAGLFRRGGSGWEPVRPARSAELPVGSHVGAIAAWRHGIAVGLFDGGLLVGQPREEGIEFETAPGVDAAEESSAWGIWGVNALCPVAGELWIASLRGAARWDGERLTAVEGPGAAFSLASTERGVAIGYAQGVRVPGKGLLSAFHGLPGNQATALASGDLLYVGTPSGLGGLSRARVAWRVTPGQDQLPHAWVTSLALAGEELWIGTYGGGVARRAPGSARLEALPETAGKKVTCLLATGGVLYAGTEGDGLWRGTVQGDGVRFRREELPLPSPVVTALAESDGSLWIGTSEGLARAGAPAPRIASAAGATP